MSISRDVLTGLGHNIISLIFSYPMTYQTFLALRATSTRIKDWVTRYTTELTSDQEHTLLPKVVLSLERIKKTTSTLSVIITTSDHLVALAQHKTLTEATWQITTNTLTLEGSTLTFLKEYMRNHPSPIFDFIFISGQEKLGIKPDRLDLIQIKSLSPSFYLELGNFISLREVRGIRDIDLPSIPLTIASQLKRVQVNWDDLSGKFYHGDSILITANVIEAGLEEIAIAYPKTLEGFVGHYTYHNSVIHRLTHNNGKIYPAMTTYLPIVFNKASLVEAQGIFPNLTSITFNLTDLNDILRCLGRNSRQVKGDVDDMMQSLIVANYSTIILVDNLPMPLPYHKYIGLFPQELRQRLQFVDSEQPWLHR